MTFFEMMMVDLHKLHKHATMDKYASALLELAKASKAVREINAKIGEALSASYCAKENTLPVGFWHRPIYPDDWETTWEKRNQHLSNAYAKQREYLCGLTDEYYINHEGDVRGYLAEHCEHALRAHDLIQERKALRQALGVAKRRVTFLGNRLLASKTS